MKSKIYIFAVFILISLLALSSCSIGHVEDTNGEDTEPVTITDGDITDGSSHVATLSSKGQANGTYYYNVRKLSGVFSLNKHSASDGSLTVNMSATLLSGNARIAIVKDGKIVADIPFGENQTVTLEGSGLYEIKIAAESAQLSIEYTLE